MLLAEYAEHINQNVPSRVPVDEIARFYLGLRLEFGDLQARYRQSNVLGAMEFERSTIAIDNSLDPELFPRRRGRYRFTVAHEIGHWQLHKSRVLKKSAQLRQSAIVCRDPDSSASYPPIEQQADYFASFLLLPCERVAEAWGENPAFTFNVYESGSRELRKIWQDLRPNPRLAREMFARECEQRFEQLAEPLAWKFDVSNHAMRKRLEGLGLLRRSAVGSANRSQRGTLSGLDG